MAEKQKITRDGWNKINEELDHLIKVRRPAIVHDIAVAREQGDLSENAEYAAAKETQGIIEDRIAELQALLDNCEIMSDDELSNETIALGSKVTLFDEDLEEEITYYLVNTAEADLDAKKISINSKLGEALFGKKVGEKVEVQAPAGVFYYSILSIQR